MVFLGLEKPVEYQRQQIFNPVTANMVLNTGRDYINAVYNEYKQGLEDLKEFNKTYGDFTSPIQKDMDWYDKNVTGKVRNFINNMYANGIDPLRSAEGRAAVSQLIYSMPVGDINKLRQSADAAREYIKNKGLLERAGKYDRDLNERFLGYDLSNYDTLNGGNGIWNITSPLEAKSLKELTEASFNNRTPHDLTKDEVLSFEGQTYDPNAKYKGFTKRDLRDIADKVAPGLYGTPYMDYYRDLAKQKLEAAGIKPTKQNVDAQLASDIANSQDEYLVRPVADYNDYYKRASLALQRERNALYKQKINNSGGGGNGKKEQEPFSYAGRLYRASLAKAASNGGIQYNWFDVQNHYGDISKSIYTTQYDFGNSVADKLYKSKHDVDRENYRKSLVKDNVPSKTIAYRMKLWDNIHKNDKSNEQVGKSRQMIDLFRNRYEIETKDPGTFVQWHGGSTVDGNKHVIQASDADLSKLFGERFIISHTAGNKNIPLNDNAKLRNLISQYGSSNTTITPLNRVYGALMQDDGAFHTYTRVKITINRGENEKPIVKYAYYDMGIHSGATSGGARNTDYNKQRKIAQGGYRQIGSVGLHYDPNTRQMVPNDVRYTYDPNATHEVDSEYNIYPDASSWLEFGPQDARVNAYLKAKGSVYNEAYGPEAIDYDDFLFFDE